MKLQNLRWYALGCALLVMLASCAVADEAVKDQVKCFTTWDDLYFYLAFKVDCPNVQGTHTAPNTEVNGDDAVTAYIDTGSKAGERISMSCFSMTVSAAGGAQFKAGNADGKLAPEIVYSCKYGAAVQGTINNDDDIDMGYSVEMAIPWEIMKTARPHTGDMIGVNVVVRRHGANGGFVSLSPHVKTEEDLANPSKWVKLVFASYSFSTGTTNIEKIVSTRYLARAPLINGVINDKEWNQSTSFSADIPMPAGYVYEAKFPIQRTTFATYEYAYQADTHKPAPGLGITKDGTIALADFPAAGAGPWFSCDRVLWHKNELSEMADAGIDVVLPVYYGDKASRAAFADKGLDCLVAALQELRDEGKPQPLVGMMLDLDRLSQIYGQKPDFKSDEVKRTFYGIIKDFFDRVPSEYRAVAQTGKPNPGRQANIVFLRGENQLYSTPVDYCNEQFNRDFGCALVWIAETPFEDFNCDGSEILHLENPPQPPRIQVGRVVAGLDSSQAIPTNRAQVFSRMGGDTYTLAWSDALKRNPPWIICDGWTSFDTGQDLSASREYGKKYVDLTRANTKKFANSKDFDAHFLRYSVPKVIAQKQFAMADLVIKNTGKTPWTVADGYAITYRWYRGGRFFGDSKVKLPLDKDVAPGEIITFDIGIGTVNSLGIPIPEGDCELRFEVMRLSDGKWLSSLGGSALIVPLTIGTPKDWDATYLNCNAPVMVGSKRAYETVVRVRNDGAQTWPKGITKLGCRLFKVSNYTHDSEKPLDEEVTIKEIKASLGRECKPGEIATFDLALDLSSADKEPLEAWKQDDSWSYQMRFDVFNGQQWLSEAGARPLNRVVDIFDRDLGARIVDSDVPRNLEAGGSIEAKVVLRNTGAEAWDRKHTRIGYHWYHVDGTELLWDGPATYIKTNIPPGWPVVTTATVTAPTYPGQYVLVWDLMIDDQWLSTEPISHGGDILPVFVEVTGGKLAFADLSKLFDTVAESADTARTTGDFDSNGASFPSEQMPPDIGVNDDVHHIYPSGYNWDRESHPDGRISFSYPDKASGAKTAVTCRGQRVAVENGSYVAMHILGASSGGDVEGGLTLEYSGGSETANLKISDWGTGAKNGEKVALAARHRHAASGDETGKSCYLYDYAVLVDKSKTLTGITLPSNGKMKVVAITFERASMPILSVAPPVVKKK